MPTMPIRNLGPAVWSARRAEDAESELLDLVGEVQRLNLRTTTCHRLRWRIGASTR